MSSPRRTKAVMAAAPPSGKASTSSERRTSASKAKVIESLGRRYAGSVEESQHRLSLSRRPPQLFQRLLERRCRSVVGSERESRFAFRFEALTHFFFDRDAPRFDQVF